MIGVVVATHGKLAEEMIRTAEAVVGRLEQVVPVSVVATSPDMRGDLKAAIQRVDQGEACSSSPICSEGLPPTSACRF